MQIHALPAFTDNYVWMLVAGRHAVAVDPGDAAPVERYLDAQGLQLDAILITHHHPDHIGGIPSLLSRHALPVYGPAAESERIRNLSAPLGDGDHVEVLGRRFEVIAVPGHTLGHIAYYAAPTPDGEAGLLLCGDTLFSAGCGRLFEGSAEQMYASLERLAALPDDTRICCTHEYTLANLAFAQAVEPDNAEVAAHLARVRELRARDQPSLPSTLGLERRINPFLRGAVAAVRAAAEAWTGTALGDPVAVFAAVRRWKDGYRAPR
ncbi:hydroxyacylglutathione hydrolase [Fontimonas sp. SYSU GA230001]|uniref:hydroxyacylglutathione hydrolase n=1 Tax=Fontimonas sp. SYSU GA230001 TaxID=3142450 RepID=UPI0032B56F87